MKERNNFTEKKITEFDENDTFYMQKNISGFTYTFLLRFKSFSRGNITGEILGIQPNNQKSIWIGKEVFRIGSELTGKISKCYTYKPMSGAKWFKKVSNDWSCS
jgi:hypothetical protein